MELLFPDIDHNVNMYFFFERERSHFEYFSVLVQ